MRSKLQFLLGRLSEKLWVRPLGFCLAAVVAALAAAFAGTLDLGDFIPEIAHDTAERLLSIIAATMLGVATFAVGSMVSAYASVSSSATPRAFSLVISDDVSKTALSTFVAAFIFSVIALVAIKTGYYGRAGLFTIFCMTIAILGWVIITFVRWVDKIARLGRLRTTIDRIEQAAESAIERRRRAPYLGGIGVQSDADRGDPLFSDAIGYVQHVDVAALQRCAEKDQFVLTLAAQPGTFAAPGRALAYLRRDEGDGSPTCDIKAIMDAFVVGPSRTFEDDPRFGLIALSEIAGRALSPAVNDPGTAIEIVGVFVRLFALWVSPLPDDGAKEKSKFDRIRVPPLRLDDMFDDAFTAIARDGAGTIEVVTRLQKAFASLSTIDDAELRAAASRHARCALARAERALQLPEDIERSRALSALVG